MKKKKTNFWMLAALLTASTSVASAQILESVGTAPTNTTILAHESANAFDEDLLTYSGSGLVRNTDASSGYSGASGLANVFLRAGETWVIELINTNGCTTSDSLIFGIRKNINASNGSELKVQYESAPGVWTNLTFAALPTGAGTSHWYRRAAALPSGALSIQMRFRFINTTVGGTSTNPQFRIDDMSLSCGEVFDCSQVEAPVLSSDTDSIFCNGGSATLTTTFVEDASYAFYQVINGTATEVQAASGDIDYVANASGTYYVVQNFDGCISQSNLIWIREYESPTMTVSFSPSGPVPPSTVVTATADLTNDGLFFSQYVEGSDFNKYLEIYNPTNATINLTGYTVKAYHNGSPFSGSPNFTINLSGTIASGATYVIRHTSATAWGGVSQQATGDLQFNGNDALVLEDNSSNILDIFGSVGNDPITEWRGDFGGVIKGTENRTFLRKSCIYRGVTVNPGLPGKFGFPTLALEWDTAAVDTNNSVVGLGSHNYGIDFSWGGTNGSFVGGDNIGASVDFTVGQQGSSTLTANVTGLCDFNDCAETGNSGVIQIEGTRMMTINSNEAAGMNMSTYPNPFTSTVNIAVETAQDGMVKIEVLDMMGKVVAVVANTEVNAGKHNFVFDGSNLNSGTYTARIVAGNSVQTVRLVKTK